MIEEVVANLAGAAHSKKVLLLTPSTEIKYAAHRGTYVYTKSLFAALKYLGHSTSFFTQSAAPADARALLPEIIHGLTNPTNDIDWYGSRDSWLKSLYRTEAKEVRNNFSIADWKWRFLSDVDYFFNSPHFFDAQEYAASCARLAPKDVAGRVTSYLKQRSGEIENGVIDIDFVSAAGYEVIITTAPTPIRSRSGRVKVVQTVLDLIPFEYPLGQQHPSVYLSALAKALQYADHILSISHYTSSSLSKVLPEYASKSAVVHLSNPLETVIEQFSQRSSSDTNWLRISGLEKQKYFFYVGAIERRKNIEVLVRAFLMLDRELGLKLVLAGPLDGTYLRETGLEEYFKSAEARSDGVIYAGFISDERKLSLLQNATALVFPSLLEGFGLPIVEAMSAGCPTITTRGSSLSEVGDDAVLYLEDPSSVSELAGLLTRVFEDKALAKNLRDKGLRRAQSFTIKAYAGRLRDWGMSEGIFS